MRSPVLDVVGSRGNTSSASLRSAPSPQGEGLGGRPQGSPLQTSRNKAVGSAKRPDLNSSPQATPYLFTIHSYLLLPPQGPASPTALSDTVGSRRKRITRNTAVGATLAVALVGRGRKPGEHLIRLTAFGTFPSRGRLGRATTRVAPTDIPKQSRRVRKAAGLKYVAAGDTTLIHYSLLPITSPAGAGVPDGP